MAAESLVTYLRLAGDYTAKMAYPGASVQPIDTSQVSIYKDVMETKLMA